MINVGRILNSRNLSQPFTVYRQTGLWQGGRWVTAENPIQMQGVVTVAKPKDLVQVPEGDRVTGAMCFYSQQEIFETHTHDQTQSDGTSDQIVWNGDRYRISSVMPWSDYGYYKAIGVRMESE